MKTSEKLWENTNALDGLNIFPGLLGEFLIESREKTIEKTKKFLPYIFWRWYFLECEYRQGTNPYLNLDYLRKIEKWPKDGQFFAQPELKEISQDKLDISINLDYISFEEQPLFIDLKNILTNDKLIFNFDKRYHNDLDFLVGYWRKNDFGNYFSSDKLQNLIKVYFEKNLKEWYEEDNFIQKAFTLESWFFFWQKTIKDINQKKDYNTEELNNDFFGRMRQFFPEYGYLLEELDTNPKLLEKENFSGASYFNFWFRFSCKLLLPFSLYLHLFAPVFLDQRLFRDDIKKILNYDYQDPLFLCSACSYLYLTPFGQKIFII